MDRIFSIAQMVLSVVLIACILLQARGGDLGAAFGGGGEVYRTKRGVEKILFVSSIIVAIAFFSLAFYQMVK